MTFASIDKNKEILEKYTGLWDKIKNLIKKIDYKPGKYGKDFMKIMFESDDDDLSLNKILKFHMLTIIITSVFKVDGEYYP